MDSAHTMTAQQQAVSLTAILGSTFFLGLSHGIGYPLTATTFEAWGAPASVTGLAAGMPALATLMLLPFAPRLAARFGFVPTMVAGLAIGITGFLLLPVFPFIEAWMVLRFLSGAGLTLPWLLGETWINAVSTDANRGRVLAGYVMGLFGGYGAGPIVLGLLPTGIAWASGAAAVALALTGIALLLARRYAPAIDEHASGGIRRMLTLAPVAMITGLLAGVVEYGYIGLLPVVAMRSGLDTATALQLVSAFLWGGVTLSLFFGWLSDRISRSTVLALTLVLFVVLAVAASSVLHDRLLALAATFVLGGAASNMYVLGLAIIGDRIAPRDLAAANAAFLMLYQVGTLVGPPLSGAALDVSPVYGFTASIVVFAILAGVAMWLAERWQKPCDCPAVTTPG